MKDRQAISRPTRDFEASSPYDIDRSLKRFEKLASACLFRQMDER